MKAGGKTIYEVPKDQRLEKSANITLSAIKSGIAIIYQAVFFQPCQGNADFFVKCSKPSSLGDFSYEVLYPSLIKTRIFYQ